MPRCDCQKIARFQRSAHARWARCLKLGKEQPGQGAGSIPLGGERRGEEAPRERPHEGPTLHYSITSSARASSDGGMVSAMALAVLRLMTNSSLVGCSTGKSAGLAPLRTLSTCWAARL